jgi:hypothetical protein
MINAVGVLGVTVMAGWNVLADLKNVTTNLQ